MLLTAYANSLYKDKIRQTPLELFTDSAVAGNGQPSADAGPNYNLYLFMTELFCLFFTLPLALRLSRSRIVTGKQIGRAHV